MESRERAARFEEQHGGDALDLLLDCGEEIMAIGGGKVGLARILAVVPIFGGRLRDVSSDALRCFLRCIGQGEVGYLYLRVVPSARPIERIDMSYSSYSGTGEPSVSYSPFARGGGNRVL